MGNIAIKVDSVSKSFKLPHEKHSTVKSSFINVFRGKRTYEKQDALKDVSLEIKKGEFFGIVGRNGSGKSTLLKLLAGIYSPNSGVIAVNGKLTPFIELGVGFNQELTGRENVFLNGSLLGFSRDEMEVMYDDIVKFAELKKFMDQKLKNYSSGMQVRLAFSIAIRAKGDILVLDEVLAVGDAAFQQKCYSYFEELKNEKRTVILVSHNMDVIKRFCTRAVYMEEGSVKRSGDIYEIADSYTEDNLLDRRKSDKKATRIDKRIKFSIVKEDSKSIKFKISYKCPRRIQCFINLNVVREGVLVGAIDTSNLKPIKNSGALNFSIDKTILNSGVYTVGGGISNSATKERIDSTGPEYRVTFFVKDKDPTRRGSLKLEERWEGLN